MPEVRRYNFTVYLDDGDPAEMAEKESAAMLDHRLSPKVTPQDDSGGATLPSATSSPLSDEEILRGIRAIETLAGRRSKGTSGGYSEKRDDTDVYGAYQIKPKVWQSRIKSKFGWDLADWYKENPTGEEAVDIKKKQDKIAKDILLPDYKKTIADKNLYSTPLGKYLPKGSLEIISQLGTTNLETFLKTGFDKTAFSGKKDGQIMGYLMDSMALLGRKVPPEFFNKLNEMGGVKTKYSEDRTAKK